MSKTQKKVSIPFKNTKENLKSSESFFSKLEKTVKACETVIPTKNNLTKRNIECSKEFYRDYIDFSNISYNEESITTEKSSSVYSQKNWHEEAKFLDIASKKKLATKRNSKNAKIY